MLLSTLHTTRWPQRAMTLVALLCVLAPRPATAAAAAGITGSVLDPDGRAVVGAAVLIRNDTTNQISATTTDASGRFSDADLTPGAYTIEVAVPGFDIVRRNGVQLSVG